MACYGRCRYGFLPTPSRRASAAGLSVDDALADMDAGPSDNVEEWELIDFLSQADATAAFMAHLASEFSVESLKFWLHAGEFADSANHWAAGGGEEQPQSVAREHMLMRATWILETYILDDAPLRVNVSYAQQQKVQVRGARAATASARRSRAHSSHHGCAPTVLTHRWCFVCLSLLVVITGATCRRRGVNRHVQ